MNVKLTVTNIKHNITKTKSSFITFRSENQTFMDILKSTNKSEDSRQSIEVKKISVLGSPMILKSNFNANETALVTWKQENVFNELNSVCTSSNLIIFTCASDKDIRNCYNSDYSNHLMFLNCSLLNNDNYDLNCDPEFSLKLLKYYYFSYFNNSIIRENNLYLETLWNNDYSKYIIGDYQNSNKSYIFLETSDSGNKYISNQVNLDKILINTSETNSNNTSRNNTSLDIINNQTSVKEKFILICSRSEEFNSTYYISCLYYVTNVSCILSNSNLKEEEVIIGRQLQSKGNVLINSSENQLYLQYSPYWNTLDNSNNYTVSVYVNDSDIVSKHSLNFTYKKPVPGICNLSPSFFLAFNSTISVSFNYWKSDNLPLSYRIYVKDINNLSYFIEEGFFTKSGYKFPNFFPNFTKIYLDVIDNKGITNRFLCISKDNSFVMTAGKLESQLYLNLYDPFRKIELCYYLSTFRRLSNEEVNIFYLNFITVIKHIKSYDNRILFLRNKYSTLVKILLDYQIIRQYSKRDKSIEVYNDFLQIIVEKIDSYIYSEDSIKMVYSFINEIGIASKTFSNSTNMEILRYTSLKYIFNYNILKYASPTISLSFKGEEFDILISTISIYNNNKVLLSKDYEMDLPNLTIWDNCDMSSNFCLNKSETLKLFKNYNEYDVIRIFVDYSNTSIFPLTTLKQESILSSSILTLEVYGLNKESNLLEFEFINFRDDFTMNSLISLSINNNSFSQSHYTDSACVQIAPLNDFNDISNYEVCETWFYKDSIFCDCTNKGITFAIIDSEIARKSRFIQFPTLDQQTSIFFIT